MHQYTFQFEMVCWEIQDAVKTETTKGKREILHQSSFYFTCTIYLKVISVIHVTSFRFGMTYDFHLGFDT